MHLYTYGCYIWKDYVQCIIRIKDPFTRTTSWQLVIHVTGASVRFVCCYVIYIWRCHKCQNPNLVTAAGETGRLVTVTNTSLDGSGYNKTKLGRGSCLVRAPNTQSDDSGFPSLGSVLKLRQV